MKKKTPILWIETQKNTKGLTNLTSQHRAEKNLKIAKTLSKNVNKEAFFKKVIFFLTLVFRLFTCANQCTKNELFR